MQDFSSNFTVVLAILCAYEVQHAIVTSACHVTMAIDAGPLKLASYYKWISER